MTEKDHILFFPCVVCVNDMYRYDWREEINIYLLLVLSDNGMANLDNRSHGIWTERGQNWGT